MAASADGSPEDGDEVKVSDRTNFYVKKSTKEVLPLLLPRYQHGASLFGFWWKAEDGGIEPLGITPPRFSRPVADHLAASSIKGCLAGLEPAID